MIKAEALTRTFGGITAVQNVDLEVPRGSVTGFLGPNGAGKTTTMRMLCGVLTPSTGSAWIDDIDVVAHPERARGMVGYLPESAPVYPEMRVAEYLGFRSRLYGVPRPRAAIDQALDRCGLTEVRRRIIGQLSKGYRQRVALAAALLHEPGVLILDEPTAGLDPTQIDAIRALILDLSGDRAILLSTHVLSEVEALCDAIVMIAGGQVLSRGTLDEVCRPDVLICQAEVDDAGYAAVQRGVTGTSRIDLLGTDGAWTRCRIWADPGIDPRSAVLEAVLAAGGRLRELHAQRPALEDVFRAKLSGPSAPGDRA